MFNRRWALSAGLLAIFIAFYHRHYFTFSSRLDVQPDGHVIILAQRDIPSIINAANVLAMKGMHILMGVPSKDMIHYISKQASKGIELIEVDMQEPAHIAKIVYRSKEIKRDLNRPLVGVIMLYPDGNVGKSLNGTGIDDAIDLRRLDKSWNKAFVTPMRVLGGTLPALLDPEENGGRILIIEPFRYITPSFVYEDFIAHSAFIAALDGLRSDFLTTNNISVSVLTATTSSLAQTDLTSDAAKVIVHAMLSPYPRNVYSVGYVEIWKYSKTLSIRIPLWLWRVVDSVVPLYSNIFTKRQKSSSNDRHSKRKSKSNTRKSKGKRINPLNTYEHLAMKP